MNDPKEPVSMLTASLNRISQLEDHLDLMTDEFQRIKALTDNAEIQGLCERAMQQTKQRVSVIRQRDEAETEVEKLRAALKPVAESADWFFSGINDANIICGKLTVGHLRAAQAALAPVASSKE